MELDPASLPLADRYKLLIGGIVPRPIAWVSTLSPDGRPNLAPFSFFNGIGSSPMSLLFCPVNKPDGSRKDTLINVMPVGRGATGEFVVNVATEPQARVMAATAEMAPYGESEFELVGLKPAPSRVVKPARVEGAPVAYECRVLQVIELNAGQPLGGNVVIGEVVHVFVRDDVADEKLHFDSDALKAIGRMGGPSYTRTRERFEMPQGLGALKLPPME